jgi:hypothetical protein
MAALKSSVKSWKWAGDFRAPSRYAIPLGQTLERLGKQRGGTWKPKDVVSAARDPKSAIHGLFEWNEKRAAEKWREEQARCYIRHLVVIIPNGNGGTMIRAAVSFGGGSGYQDSVKAMESPELRERLIAQALSEAESWRARYQHIKELSAIFAAIGRTAKRLQEKRKAG